MDEFTLIKNLEKLQTVKPRQEWVVSAKAQILEKQFEAAPKASFVDVFSTVFGALRQPRFATAFSAIVLVLAGSFTVVSARDAVPGDALYAVKQMQEKVMISFITSPEQKTIAKVEQVSNRLAELDKVSKQSENQERKIAAVTETKKALSQAAKEIAKLPEDQKAGLIEILAVKIEQVEKSTDTAIMDKTEPSYQEIYKFLADSEIKELEANEQNLTAKQKELLTTAKEFFVVEKYSEALDAVYQIQPNNTNTEDNQGSETETDVKD